MQTQEKIDAVSMITALVHQANHNAAYNDGGKGQATAVIDESIVTVAVSLSGISIKVERPNEVARTYPGNKLGEAAKYAAE